ncbi:MAG: substrate-binding domain-containing protein [Ruminococcus sp.]|nr:substrate-binding domain-containing protein [Ruminococcus sp.]
MDKSTSKKLFRSVAVCALSATMLFSGSCGKPKEDKVTIAVITKQDISFWGEVKKGAEDAGRELGCDIIYNVATSDNDYASQIEFINNAINDKVDAIVIAPNGNKELEDAYQRASDAGIKLININSRSDFKDIITCISSSDTDAGAVAARHSAEVVLNSTKMREKFSSGTAQAKDIVETGSGAILIIGHTAEATAEPRIEGYEKECINQMISMAQKDNIDITGGSGRQPSQAELESMFEPFFIDDTQRCSTVDAAYDETMKYLTGKDADKILTIFATNTNTTLGVCKAVQEKEMAGKIHVVGFNSDEQEINYLRSGVADGLVIQNPYTMGYVGVSYANKAVDDNAIPAALDTGVTYVSADNLNDEYVQLLLHPDTY